MQSHSRSDERSSSAAVFADVAGLVDAFAEELREGQRIPGLAVCLVDRGGVVHVGLHGFADLPARQAPSPDMLWQIGSIGKSFTALVLVQLAAEGLVDLDERMTHYMPWFGGREEITVHQLLVHTAGLGWGWEFGPDSRFEVMTAGQYGEPLEPGRVFNYSNHGYEALGYLVEEVTGQSLPDAIADRVLKRCGMTQSMARIEPKDYDRSVRAHQPLYDDRPYDRRRDQIPAPWLLGETADGSICASPSDMGRYLQMILNRGASDPSPVLSEASFELFSARHVQDHRRQFFPVGTRTFHGYGIALIDEESGDSRIGYDGGMVGFRAGMWGDPELGVGVVTMINGEGDWYPLQEYALAAMRATVRDQPLPEPPPPAPPVPARVFSDPDAPEELKALTGTYRSYSPWYPCIRVIATGEELQLAIGGGVGKGTAMPLVPLGDERFRLGHEDSPDILSFDSPLDGRPLRAEISGCRYYRALHDAVD